MGNILRFIRSPASTPTGLTVLASLGLFTLLEFLVVVLLPHGAGAVSHGLFVALHLGVAALAGAGGYFFGISFFKPLERLADAAANGSRPQSVTAVVERTLKRYESAISEIADRERLHAHLLHLLRSSPVPCMQVDRNLMVLCHNRAMARLVGKSEELSDPWPLSDILDRESEERATSLLLTHLFRRESEVSCVVTLKSADASDSNRKARTLVLHAGICYHDNAPAEFVVTLLDPVTGLAPSASASSLMGLMNWHTINAFAAADSDNRLVYANQAFADLIGAPNPQAVLGTDVLLLHPQEWLSSVYPKLVLELRSTGSWRGPMVLRHRAGHTVERMVTMNYQKDDAGKTIRCSVLFDAQAAPQHPRMSQEDDHVVYKRLFALAPTPLVRISTRLTIDDCNDAFVAMCGMSDRGSVIGKDVCDLLPVDADCNESCDRLKSILASQPAPSPFFGAMRKPSGQVIEIVSNWDYVRDDEGKVLGVIATVERLSTGEKTRVMRDMDRLLEASPAIVIQRRANDQLSISYITANVSHFGLDAAQLVVDHEPFYSIVDVRDHDSVSTHFSSLLQCAPSTRSTVPLRYRITGPAGTTWVEEQTWAVRNDRGQVTHFQGIAIDISDRIRAEDAEAQASAVADQLRTELKLNQVGHWALKADSMSVSLTDEAAELLNFAPGKRQVSLREALRRFKRSDQKEILRCLRASYGAQESSELLLELATPVSRGGRAGQLVNCVSESRSVGAPKEFLAHGSLQLLLKDAGVSEHSSKQSQAGKAVVDLCEDAIITIDHRGMIDSANGAATRMFGYRHDELRGHNVSMLMPSPYNTEHDGYIARYIAEGNPHVIGIGRQVTAKSKSGRVFPIHLALSEWSLEGKRYFTGIVRDLTEARNAEERAKLADERLKRLFRWSPDALILTDSHGHITDWNPAAEALLLWQSSEAIGQNAIEMLGGDSTGQMLPDELVQFLTGEALASTELRCDCSVARRDASSVPVSISVSRFESGAGPAYCIFARDMSELVRKSEALKEQADALAARNDELAKARATAEDLARLKTDFLASMSHEIRTPMNGILGALELLDSKSLPENQAKLLNVGRDSAENLLTIINDVLDITGIEAGKLKLNVTEWNLANTLQSVIGLHAVRANQKDLKLKTRGFDDFDYLVRGDQGRVRQVLNNFIGNAIKFTQQGSVEVSVREGNEAGVVRFEVRDTGQGIPASFQDRIFEKFSRAPGTEGGKTPGTGLGLAICKQVVEALAGTVGFESVEGQGTTFWCELPLHPADAHDVMRMVRPITDHVDGGRLDGARIMLVEDTAANQLVISEMLKSLGADVVVCEDGQACLRTLKDHEVDVVIMDCQMPVMDGFAATRAIRGELGMGTLPIIALTADILSRDKEACRNAGMNDFLSKPCSTRDLARVIGRWLRSAQPAANVPAPATPARTVRLEKPPVSEVTRIGPFAIADALERFKGNEAAGKRYLQTLVGQLTNSKADLLDCVQQMNLPGIKRIAHSVKGSVSMIAAVECASMARSLEMYCEHAFLQTLDRSTLHGYMRELTNSMDKVIDAIHAHLDHLQPAPPVVPRDEKATISLNSSSEAETAVTPGRRPTQLLPERELLARFVGSRDIGRQVVAILQDEGAATLQRLESALQQMDVRQARNELHRFRGSISNVVDTDGEMYVTTVRLSEILRSETVGEQDVAVVQSETARIRELLHEVIADLSNFCVTGK